MSNPWDGPRYRSWASNTVLTTVLLIVLVIATVITDLAGEPPTYLVGLLGTAAGAFFAAVGSDKGKRDGEVSDTAARAESKVDKLADVARHEHPDTVRRADAAEEREHGWSSHRDHPRGRHEHD